MLGLRHASRPVSVPPMMKLAWIRPVAGLMWVAYRLPKLVSFLFRIFHCMSDLTNGSSGYKAKTFAPVFGLAFAPRGQVLRSEASTFFWIHAASWIWRSEEHTSELQSPCQL